jgi:hypothetical protein
LEADLVLAEDSEPEEVSVRFRSIFLGVEAFPSEVRLALEDFLGSFLGWLLERGARLVDLSEDELSEELVEEALLRLASFLLAVELFFAAGVFLPDAAALAFLVPLGLLEARAASFFMLKIKRSSSVGVLLPGAARLPCFFRVATLSSVEDSEVEESEVEEDESPEDEEEKLSLRDAAALAAGVLPAFLVLADLLEARSEEDESSAVSFFMLRIKRSSSAGVLLPGAARLALLFCMAGAPSAEDAEVESSEDEEDESSEEEEDKSPEDEEDESPEEEESELSSSEEDPSLAPFILASSEDRNPHSPPCRRYIANKFQYNCVVNDLGRVFFKYPTLLSFTRGLLEDDLLGASLNRFSLN